MKVYELNKVQSLPITIDEAWKFFSTAANLEKIIPADISFKILTKLNDGPIYPGMTITYNFKPIFRIPLRWTTEIPHINAPFSFTDIQIKGPFRLWEHTHVFKARPGGVIITDLVRYALPMGFLGELAYRLVVKKKLKVIFNYRENALKKIFEVKQNT